MANPEHVAILKRGVEEWNAWREEKSTVRPDLSGADLRHRHLEFASFSNANLEQASLTGARLQSANFHSAQLNGAKLDKAKLGLTKLVKAKLVGTDLRGADLRGARLEKATLLRADLREANLYDADLREVNLSEADMRGTILKQAQLTFTVWDKARLNSRTKFEHARFEAEHVPLVDRSDTIPLSRRDHFLNWAVLRAMGLFPIFGVSWFFLVVLLLFVSGIGFVNDNDLLRTWIPQGVPIPVRSRLALVASVALVIASTFYRFGCPHRVQEFSETEWVEQHGQPRVLYIADKLSHGVLQWLTLVCSVAGGGLTLYLMGDLLWMAFRAMGAAP